MSALALRQNYGSLKLVLFLKDKLMMKRLVTTAALSAMIAAPAFAGVADGWEGEAALTGSKTGEYRRAKGNAVVL